MGGDLYKNKGLPMRRYNKKEYFDLAAEMMTYFTVSGYESYVGQSNRAKPDFGDLDIMVRIPSGHMSVNNYLSDIIDMLKRDFEIHADHISINDGTISVYHKEFQIDVKLVQWHQWHTFKFYYSNDPIPNILGRVYHKFGLKFGGSGLTYPVKITDTEQVGEIHISSDPTKILEFIGLDYAKYAAGFDSEEAMFEYCISSKFFNQDIFDLENLNHINRIRNKKRPSYMRFIEYLAGKPYPKYEFNEDKLVYRPAIEKAFPHAHFQTKLTHMLEKYADMKVAAAKLNGHIISNITGLKGKELGLVIVSYKKNFGDAWLSWLSENTEEHLIQDFQDWWNSHKEQFEALALA